MTVWSLLEECAGQLGEPFRRSEIVGWFRRHHPEVNEATLAAHIQAATANTANRGRYGWEPSATAVSWAGCGARALAAGFACGMGRALSGHGRLD